MLHMFQSSHNPGFAITLVCRDGRMLREDAKPKEILAIDRFVSKGGGFMAHDSTLDDLGLHDLAPSNCCRPATRIRARSRV